MTTRRHTTMNTTTRKYPRTMEEAFGPYQRYGLVERADARPRYELPLAIVAALIAAIISTLTFVL